MITAEISRDRGWKSIVHVVLERDGQTSEARQDAIGEEIVLLRCAAETTLEALHGLLGGPPRFALVGAKRVLAFDSAVILTCVRTVGGRPRKLIGCVPINEDPVLAVARAVLHATNRIIEALPNREDDDDGGDAPDDDGGQPSGETDLSNAGNNLVSLAKQAIEDGSFSPGANVAGLIAKAVVSVKASAMLILLIVTSPVFSTLKL